MQRDHHFTWGERLWLATTTNDGKLLGLELVEVRHDGPAKGHYIPVFGLTSRAKTVCRTDLYEIEGPFPEAAPSDYAEEPEQLEETPHAA